jgi:hypothetical protein
MQTPTHSLSLSLSHTRLISEFVLDNVDTAHLKELLRKEIEQRREAERTNKELRDNFLRLTHLMIQKQTIEGDLLTRLISLESEVIGIDAGNETLLFLHSFSFE